MESEYGTYAEMDLNLSLYFEHLYLEGSHLSLGTRVLNAVLFCRPEWGRGPSAYPLSRMEVRVWARQAPYRSRLPLPWEVARMLSNWLVYNASGGWAWR